MNKLRVLAMCPDRLDGCTWYRLHNFIRESRKQGTASVEFLDPTLSTEQLTEAIRKADVFYCRLNETLPFILEELQLEKMNAPLVLDLDDAFDDINPYSDSYQTQGLKEVRLQDGTYLWKDGVNEFSLVENQARIQAYTRLVKLATAVIVTTIELKNYVEKWNKNVVVIPNAINFDIFPVLPLKKDNTVTITWSGGSSHFADLFEVKPALLEIMVKNPQVYYYHVGQGFRSIITGLPERRVKQSGWVTADGHGYRLATLNADIGICPLIDSTFNTYKSSIKFYEYSAVKIATLAPNMPPYSDDITDGKTGLLYNSLDDFKTKLQYLIDHPLERSQLAENAYQYVNKNRNLKDISEEWVNFLWNLSILFKKNKINTDRIRVENLTEIHFTPLSETPQAKRIMEEGCSVLEYLNIPYYLSAGTILGIVRENRFIPHDTDIDVMVSDADPVMINTAMKKAGFSLIRRILHDDKITQLAYIKDKVIFDIEIYTKEGQYQVFYSEHGIVKLPEKFMTGELVHFNGRDYQTFSPVKDYLSWRYGNWETPDTLKIPWQEQTPALITYDSLHSGQL